MRIVKIAMLCTGLVLPAAAMAEAPRITVTGEGTVAARPDMATISLGVTSEAATAAEAMARNTENLGRVLDRLRGAGIEDRDLQTSGLSLNPNWTQSEDGAAPRITGYIASNMLTVRVRALDRLGAVLDQAVQDGANTLNGVSFGLADPEPALDEARKRAVARAQARARLLTEAAGVTLGPLVEISEGGGAFPPPMPMYREAAMAAPVPMAEGEIETSAQVTLVYELKQ
ncbi:SIMPL domain-containing protein [Cereibacter sphaeroides]|uniref:SIMPL domain-containing protein n=1 Tax=Cereibacter sphaeroides TaxID=1063 RepID=UPI001F19816F|nr:SIMPL domain-containing protein [Cereibacter sphaeroides]MCE6950380.1 SIMPL domain-containing protein [Cereibacter sphaeroides]MCE6967810.1 SIMPL domain-containing protein [Cereibacter sphaeroides]